MLHVASVCAPCCMLPELLHKVWNRSNFEPTTPNISFVPWSPKSSVTVLDLFAQLFQHCLGHATHYTWLASSLRSLTGQGYILPTRDALQVPTLFGAVASVCTSLLTRTQQCWLNNVESCCVRHVALIPSFRRNFFLDPLISHVWSRFF